MYIFLSMTVCCSLIFTPQHSVKKLIQRRLMQSASLLFRGAHYLGEKVLGRSISAQKIAAKKQLQGTANLFTQ